MHYLSEENIFLFLLQMFLLLGSARVLGELFRRLGQPAVTAEILVGIFFGPTILGRFFPELHEMIFPACGQQKTMLEAVAWLGILFFLLNAGLETNFAAAWSQRKQGIILSACDLTLPVMVSFLACVFLPSVYYADSVSGRYGFALFVAVIMTISAMPVTIRVLQELQVYKTDIGLLIMSALTLNDVSGWIVFAIILGFFSGSVPGIFDISFIVILTICFSVFSLAFGARLFAKFLSFLNRMKVPEPACSVTLICLLGLLCGALTTWIGIHALFGFFIAGIMAGESNIVSEHTKVVFSQMVNSILVPLFFASIGLKLDFIGRFDLFLVVFIFVIGVLGRYYAAYLGARLVKQPILHAKFIGLGHIPGGEMQIVIGILALQYGVINETVYVAIVFGAVTSAIIAGPLMRRVLADVQRIDWLMYMPLNHIVENLQAVDSKGCIDELAAKAIQFIEGVDEEKVRGAIFAREELMSTALGRGIAIPHARVEGLKNAVLVFGKSRDGIEWDSPDGKTVHLVFLILTPLEDEQAQLRLVKSIVSVLMTGAVIERLKLAEDSVKILEIFREAEKRLVMT